MCLLKRNSGQGVGMDTEGTRSLLAILGGIAYVGMVAGGDFMYRQAIPSVACH